MIGLSYTVDYHLLLPLSLFNKTKPLWKLEQSLPDPRTEYKAFREELQNCVHLWNPVQSNQKEKHAMDRYESSG